MSEPLPSSRGDRYDIQSRLGSGGMGVVYAAFDRVRERVVALKCLSTEHLVQAKEARSVALFEHEYHVLSQLTHPHIIEAFDYGRDHEGPYYSMECGSGQTLRARTPLPWRSACAVMRDVVSALALVHSRSLVHRDLTPLNIDCAPGKPTKLLDFGAMIPAGVPKQVVGTPAFTAPEALQQQSLDGQADLYAVGACLYYAITGQHAYPAHSFKSLYAAWCTPPAPLSSLVSDVPLALEQLVQSLLSLDVYDRPRTAAEVYERLTVIANLTRAEARGVAQAYVTKPKLVAREAQLASVRQAADAAAAGAGCAFSIVAASGLGRSRLLDSAVLEARLAGLRVARADATSGRVSALGVAHQLLDELNGDDHARGPQDTLEGTLDSEARERKLQALSQALFDACQRAPVALFVDDVHAIDDGSRALLAILAAQASEHALLLVTSSDASVPIAAGSTAGRLAEWSEPLELTALDPAQTRALLASILGDVPNIDVLTVISHRHCRGNPQLIMEFLRTLIEQDLLRYAGGEWSIANAPAAVEAAIESLQGLTPRTRRLSPDALELLEVVALDAYQIMDLTSYPRLLAHGQSSRMHRALSELVDANWVELQAEHVRLAREGLRHSLIESTSLQRQRELYGRLAERAFALGLPAVYEAHYFLNAQQPSAAVEAMERFSAFIEQHPRAEVLRHPITLSVTDALSQAQDFPGAHPSLRARFSMLSVLNAITYRGLPEFAAARVGIALQQIEPFTGVTELNLLADLPVDERLKQALTRAGERCAVPGIGGLDLLGALRGQTRLCIAAALAAYFMCDPKLLEVIPDLTPYQQLSPAIGIVMRVIAALAGLARGQTWKAWDGFQALHHELSGPAAEQLDPLLRHALRGLVVGFLSALYADHAAVGADALIDEYERYMPDNAASQRIRLYLMRGDLSSAATARRRFELLSTGLGSMNDARLFDLPAQQLVYSLCEDSAGLRRTHLALREVASVRSGWRARATVARAQLLRCQGLVAEGLAEIAPLMATIADDSSDLALAAASHVELLNAAGRWADAISCGRDHLERLRAAEAPEYRLELALSLACAATADHEQAEAYVQSALDTLERRNVTGVLRGAAFESAVRVALARGEIELAMARLARCDAHLRIGKHPALSARAKALRHALNRAVRGSSAAGDGSEETSQEGTLASATDDRTESETQSDDVDA